MVSRQRQRRVINEGVINIGWLDGLYPDPPKQTSFDFRREQAYASNVPDAFLWGTDTTIEYTDREGDVIRARVYKYEPITPSMLKRMGIVK